MSFEAADLFRANYRKRETAPPPIAAAYGIVESIPHPKVTGLPSRPNRQLP